MADTNKLAAAKTVYDDLCASLDKRGWKYTKHDDDLVVTFGVAGDDIPMDFMLDVNADRQLLIVLSRLPFTVPEDKRMDLAIATCVASYGLADGSFDFNIATGDITFRLTASFRDSRIGDGLFEYLIGVSSYSVDEYNDKFLAVSKGVMSINDFIANS
ncbi:MAG: hypothetical protein ACI396_00025 [Acutalibacteraceae bacterium]